MRNPNIVFLKPSENVKIRIVAIGRETLVKNDCPLFFSLCQKTSNHQKIYLGKVGEIPLFVIDFGRNSISVFLFVIRFLPIALSDFLEISTTTITTIKMATEMILRVRYDITVLMFSFKLLLQFTHLPQRTLLHNFNLAKIHPHQGYVTPPSHRA